MNENELTGTQWLRLDCLRLAVTVVDSSEAIAYADKLYNYVLNGKGSDGAKLPYIDPFFARVG